jgi:alpha-N-arabinofuranosidase
LRVFIEQGVSLALLHCLTSDRGGAMLEPPDYIRQAEAYALELYSYLASEQVEASVEGAPHYTITYRGRNYAIPYLEALAARDPEGERLTLLVINKHPTEAITAEIRLQGFVPQPQAEVYILNGPSLDAFNSPEHPRAVALTQADLAGAAERFTYSFPAHSATLIELEGQKQNGR